MMPWSHFTNTVLMAEMGQTPFPPQPITQHITSSWTSSDCFDAALRGNAFPSCAAHKAAGHGGILGDGEAAKKTEQKGEREQDSQAHAKCTKWCISMFSLFHTHTPKMLHIPAGGACLQGRWRPTRSLRWGMNKVQHSFPMQQLGQRKGVVG